MAQTKATKSGTTASKATKKKAVKKRSAKKKAPSKTASSATPTKAEKSGGQARSASNAKQAASQQAASQQAKAQPATTASSTSGSSQARGFNGLSVVAIIVSLVALATAGYSWYLSAVDAKLDVGQNQNRFELVDQRINGFETGQSDLSAQISQLRTQMSQSEEDFSNRVRTIRSEMDQQQSALEEQVANSEKNLSSQSEQFRQEFTTLSDSVVKLRSEIGRSIDSWTMEEAEQLMVIANQRLQFNGDTKLAAKALRMADQRLKQVADPALNETRKILATEIAQLEDTGSVDVVGTLNQLSALAASVSDLTLAGDVNYAANTNTESDSQSQPTENAQSDAGSETSTSAIDRYAKPLVDAGAELFSSLGDLIQVEKSGKSLRPVVSAEGRQLIYDKAKLIIESAQFAFIRQDAALYSERLASVRTWIMDHFDQQSDSTQSWLGRLEQMQGVSPQSDLPDISGSLGAIRVVMDSQG